MSSTKKTCKICKKTKVLQNYHKLRSKNTSSACKECTGDLWRQKKYGVKPGWFKQNSKNGCYLCGLKTYKLHTKQWALSVDHDHITGKIRGILCQGCNRNIARFFDNKVRYKKVLTYLSRGSK